MKLPMRMFAAAVLFAIAFVVVFSVNPVLATEDTAAQESAAGGGKRWTVTFDAGIDSLYMFRGVNFLRSGRDYGSGIKWTDLNLTYNFTENDSLTLGSWICFGLQDADYKEVDLFAIYSRTYGDLVLSFAYLFYYTWSAPLYSHELQAKAAYTFHFGPMSLTPALGYYFAIGPDVAHEGFAPDSSSYLEARVDGSIPLYKEMISLAPWFSFGMNFRYNGKVLSSGDIEYFNGANDINTGLAVPIALTGNVSLRVYGAYSHTLVDLPATKPDTFWGGVKVTLCF